MISLILKTYFAIIIEYFKEKIFNFFIISENLDIFKGVNMRFFVFIFSISLLLGCEDNKERGESENQKKTAIVIGNSGDLNSQNYNLRLTVGKVASTETVTSDSFKLKVGSSVIEQR